MKLIIIFLLLCIILNIIDGAKKKKKKEKSFLQKLKEFLFGKDKDDEKSHMVSDSTAAADVEGGKKEPVKDRRKSVPRKKTSHPNHNKKSRQDKISHSSTFSENDDDDNKKNNLSSVHATRHEHRDKWADLPYDERRTKMFLAAVRQEIDDFALYLERGKKNDAAREFRSQMEKCINESKVNSKEREERVQFELAELILLNTESSRTTNQPPRLTT